LDSLRNAGQVIYIQRGISFTSKSQLERLAQDEFESGQLVWRKSTTRYCIDNKAIAFDRDPTRVCMKIRSQSIERPGDLIRTHRDSTQCVTVKMILLFAGTMPSRVQLFGK